MSKYNTLKDFEDAGKKLSKLDGYTLDIGIESSDVIATVDKKMNHDNAVDKTRTHHSSSDKSFHERDRYNSDNKDIKNYFSHIYDRANSTRIITKFMISCLYYCGFALLGKVLYQNFTVVFKLFF